MHPREIRAAFERGENITDLLKAQSGTTVTSEEIIETAYDLQAGTYIADLAVGTKHQTKVAFGQEFARRVLAITDVGTMIEAGVGEGTTLSFVLDAFGERAPDTHGFDVSWSRVACCRDWLAKGRHGNCTLSVASLFQMPYADASFDLVYTAHTIEPNGGSELAILAELYRVASRYLVLLEPAYELASDASRARMDRLGYCKGLVGKTESLGMRVIQHELFGVSTNEANPTAITVIEKDRDAAPALPRFACPRFGDPLEDLGDSLYSPGSLRAYPKVQGIPCLRPDDGIIASQYRR